MLRSSLPHRGKLPQVLKICNSDATCPKGHPGVEISAKILIKRLDISACLSKARNDLTIIRVKPKQRLSPRIRTCSKFWLHGASTAGKKHSNIRSQKKKRRTLITHWGNLKMAGTSKLLELPTGNKKKIKPMTSWASANNPISLG